MNQSSWKADSLQVALFTPPGMPQLDALQVWQLARPGTSPDAFQRGPASPMASSFAQGVVSSAVIVIQSQVGRVDFTMKAANSDANVFPPVQISEIEKSLRLLTEMTDCFLEKFEAIRLACLCNAAEFFASTDDSAARINAVTGAATFPLGTTDHIYQFNRSMPFTSNSDFSYNRILTCGTGIVQHLLGQIGPTGVSMSMASQLRVLTFKVDVNSDPQQNISIFAKLALSELRQALLTIVSKGYEALA